MQQQVTGTGERGAWLHMTLEEASDLFPAVRFGRWCETPRHAGHRIRSAMFEAVFYSEPTEHVDTWVACLDCHLIMVAAVPGLRREHG